MTLRYAQMYFVSSNLTEASRLQNSFYALYRSFSECVFVEEEGDIVFYKNAKGETARAVAEDAFKAVKEAGWKPEIQDSLD